MSTSLRTALLGLAALTLAAGNLSAQAATGTPGTRLGLSLYADGTTSGNTSTSSAMASSPLAPIPVAHDHRTTGAIVAGTLFVGALGWIVYRSTQQESHLNRPLMVIPLGAAVVGTGALVGSLFPKD